MARLLRPLYLGSNLHGRFCRFSKDVTAATEASHQSNRNATHRKILKSKTHFSHTDLASQLHHRKGVRPFKSNDTQVTSAINIGINLTASTSSQSIAQGKAKASAGFASMLEGAAGAERGIQGSAIAGGTSGGTTSVLLTGDAGTGFDPAADLLAGLLENLASLTGNLKDDLPLDWNRLADLSDLLAKLEELLGDGMLPLPDTPGFAQLTELAKSLGYAPEAQSSGIGGPLETLAGLASALANATRDIDSDLAGQLTAFAQRMDAHTADIETTLRSAELSAEMKLKLVDSETRPNASAALAKAEALSSSLPSAEVENDGKDTARQIGTQVGIGDPGKRSLADPSRDTSSQTAAARPADAQARVAAAAPATTGTPDGLTIQAAQAQHVQSPGVVTRPEAAAYQRPEPQINLPHIAAEISRHVFNGVNRFEIRLNPPELGRIDVRLEVDQSGNVTARLAVEKSETLDLMQRDQRTLERALADAGLDADKTELEFSLKQDGSDAGDRDERQAWSAGEATGEAAPLPAQGQLVAYRGYARLDAVDLRV